MREKLMKNDIAEELFLFLLLAVMYALARVRARFVQIVKYTVLKRLKLNQSDVVLDAGAGVGNWSNVLASLCKVVISLDISKANCYAVKRMWKRKNVEVIMGDTTALPLRSRSVDKILCLHVLEHVEEPLNAFSEFARVLKAGILLMETPDSDFIANCSFPITQFAKQYLLKGLEKMPYVILGPSARFDQRTARRLVGHVREGFSKKELSTLGSCNGLKLEEYCYRWSSRIDVFLSECTEVFPISWIILFPLLALLYLKETQHSGLMIDVKYVKVDDTKT